MTDDAPDIATADITSLIMDDHEWFRRQYAAHPGGRGVDREPRDPDEYIEAHS